MDTGTDIWIKIRSISLVTTAILTIINKFIFPTMIHSRVVLDPTPATPRDTAPTPSAIRLKAIYQELKFLHNMATTAGVLAEAQLRLSEAFAQYLR